MTDDVLMKVAEDLGHAFGRLLRQAGKAWAKDTKKFVGAFIKGAKNTTKGRDAPTVY